MRNRTRLLLGAIGLLGTVAAAHADDSAAAPDFVVSGGLALQSDYRFRGIAQNKKDPSEEGTLNVVGPDGFYAGTWLAKLDWTLDGVANNPSLEVDEYAGKHTDLWGTDLNIEAYYYSYPDARTFGGKKASYFEAIGQLSHTFGPLTLTGTYAYSPEFTLGGGTGNYVEGTATYVINDWLSVSGNVGHQWVQGARAALAALAVPVIDEGDYTHADLGITGTYHSFTLDARYATTTLSNAVCSGFYMSTPNACSGGAVVTLSYNVANLFP